tara:strand:- start:11777 stop:13186 length:1410 start_codon:yes stop_codon:yes gene_type:complete
MLSPDAHTQRREEDEAVQTSRGATAVYSVGTVAWLYGFLFGLDLMGASFKVLGGKSAGQLFSSIHNPLAGLMVGVLGTVLVQSSSTSTSVVVGMVGADILSVSTAIPIIMGANIGTSVTNTIVSLGQIADRDQYRLAFSGATVHDCFNLLSVIIFLPIECATGLIEMWTSFLTGEIGDAKGGSFKSPLKYIVSPVTNLFLVVDKKKINKIAEGELEARDAGSLTKGGWFSAMDDGLAGGLCLALSLVTLCVCLYGIVRCLQILFMGRARECIRSAVQFTDTYWGGYVAMLVGVGATIAVQSSSITTSALTPLVGIGVITLDQMFPLTLGANIGTTCTGLLAAMVSAKKAALQIALAHLSFNCFGILVWYPFPPIRQVPLRMAKVLGVLAWHYSWFPPVYVGLVFIVTPLVTLGISQLFLSGPIGIIAASVTCVIVATGAISGLVYACRGDALQNLVEEVELRELEAGAP